MYVHDPLGGGAQNSFAVYAKNGGNGFLWRVAPVGQAQAQIIDKLDEACTNEDDRMMLVQHSSGDRVMS